jgi:alpha-beta hydrolase superfamily lysophospholipase
MGTGGRNPLASAGLALIAVIKLFLGERHVSKLIDSMAFSTYNKRFEGDISNDPSLWLTTDEETRKAYYSDKYCGFKFTVSAMANLIKMIKDCNSAKWYKNVDTDMPILLVAGSEDPVGNYSKGVREVEALLKANGAQAKCIIYDGARHEILNDVSRNSVIKDIIDFSAK